MILAFVVAAAVFWFAFDGGSYTLASRSTLAIGLWWSVLVAVALGLWPLARPPRAAVATAALLALFAVLTGLSIAWAESTERSLAEVDRVLLYLGVLVVTLLAAGRGSAARWLDGLALGMTAVGLLALATRLFPDVLPAGQVPDFLPAAVTRLSYPVEYWNGLAILIGLALPLLLATAISSAALAWRALAVASIPGLAAAMYLTSSRGGFGVAAVGIGVFLATTSRRWGAIAALALAGAGSAAAIAVLLARDELVNDPFGSPLASEQGRSAALAIAVVSLLAGVVYALGARYLPRVVRIPTVVGRLAAIVGLLALAAALVAARPADRLETFKQPPTQASYDEQDLVRAHLLSGNGSGRWQFWQAAYEQFREHPLLGDGAGSYEAWWAEKGSVAMFVRDAHSLYLETLGELGLAGLVLLLSVFAVGLAVGARRLAAAEERERPVIAAALAAFSAYLVALAIDWMWELTIVSVVGIVPLGLLVGPATGAATDVRGADPPRRRPLVLVARLAAIVAAVLVIGTQALPLLGALEISNSQAAAREGDLAQALAEAETAQRIEPWAASPYLQLALVREADGALPEATRAIQAALERDSRDWRLWLVAARLQTKTGEIEAARRSIRRAANLNPRSPLFAQAR